MSKEALEALSSATLTVTVLPQQTIQMPPITVDLTPPPPLPDPLATKLEIPAIWRDHFEMLLEADKAIDVPKRRADVLSEIAKIHQRIQRLGRYWQHLDMKQRVGRREEIRKESGRIAVLLDRLAITTR